MHSCAVCAADHVILKCPIMKWGDGEIVISQQNPLSMRIYVLIVSRVSATPGRKNLRLYGHECIT